MAIPVYTLVNQTASAITLNQLGLVVPGSGSVNATGPSGFVSLDALFNDVELHTAVNAGDITVEVDGVPLTTSQSLASINPARSLLAQTLHNLTATSAPTVTDDADDGYSQGSLWVDVSNSRYYLCFDETVGAAVWQLLGAQGTDVDAHASRHLPGGADALATAAAGSVTIGATASEGTASSFARSDHTHSLAAPGAPVNVTKSAASAGSSTTPARADHKHDVATASAVAASVGQSNSEGTSSSLARADHTHAHAAGTPVNVTKSANSAGSASTFARSDHKHDVTTATAVSVGSVNAEGSATSLARSDHTHAVTGFSIAGQAQGDVLYFNGTSWVRLPAGTQGQVLTTQGAAANPSWTSPKRYPNSATNPVSPTPAAGDTYYNTALQMEMAYDGSRSKWLSVESATLQFGRNGDLTPAGTYMRAINGMVTSATLGYDALYNGTVVGVTLRRSTQSPASYAVVASGTDIATLAFPNLVFGVRTTTANGDFAQGDVLAARLVSDAVTPESDVQMFVRIRWRAT